MGFYRNEGELFDAKQLASLPGHAVWSSAAIKQARRGIEDAKERIPPREDEQPLDRNETRYYWVGFVLRALGFCASVAEITPADEDIRPDFTLFYTSDDFKNARNFRGMREFFEQSVGLVRVLSWGASLDEQEISGEIINPAFVLDRLLRVTGAEWGVLTNGQHWRLYHRDSSGTLTTFYEVDLEAALAAGDDEAFKYFWYAFNPASLSRASGSALPAYKLLA
jgi:hypothetical protein